MAITQTHNPASMSAAFVVFWVEGEACFCLLLSFSALRGDYRKGILIVQGLFCPVYITSYLG